MGAEDGARALKGKRGNSLAKKRKKGTIKSTLTYAGMAGQKIRK